MRLGEHRDVAARVGIANAQRQSGGAASLWRRLRVHVEPVLAGARRRDRDQVHRADRALRRARGADVRVHRAPERIGPVGLGRDLDGLVRGPVEHRRRRAPHRLHARRSKRALDGGHVFCGKRDVIERRIPHRAGDDPACRVGHGHFDAARPQPLGRGVDACRGGVAALAGALVTIVGRPFEQQIDVADADAWSQPLEDGARAAVRAGGRGQRLGKVVGAEVQMVETDGGRLGNAGRLILRQGQRRRNSERRQSRRTDRDRVALLRSPTGSLQTLHGRMIPCKSPGWLSQCPLLRS